MSSATRSGLNSASNNGYASGSTAWWHRWRRAAFEVLSINSLSTFDATPPLTGRIGDTPGPGPYLVTINGVGGPFGPFPAVVVENDWILPDDTIAPGLAPGTYTTTIDDGLNTANGVLVILEAGLALGAGTTAIAIGDPASMLKVG